MKNEHYNTYYSAKEAQEVVRKNKERMDAECAVKCKVRNAIDDRREAKALGMTIGDYLSMIH
jgi:hypothetical protein